MTLCKDLVEGRIRFYWTSQSGALLSPMMATLQEAAEWWTAFQFSQYEGPERRCSIIDRRSDHDKRRRFESRDANPMGRRTTDRPVRVDCDMATPKIDLINRMETSLEAVDRPAH
ncbi:hypothetical protein [Marinobacterium weihaiense]|uniref:Uncharacterized protein n=1 Tax=Marinobacterium weihaiense TaxID=2851016 RepID=A0ABS6MDY3_9GAMM|nr:hypothetical protein [Marinobacterium weihaiense]MBV0934512.1 hypothetical protein [Marinobacterium weihaiense]